MPTGKHHAPPLILVAYALLRLYKDLADREGRLVSRETFEAMQVIEDRMTRVMRRAGIDLDQEVLPGMEEDNGDET